MAFYDMMLLVKSAANVRSKAVWVKEAVVSSQDQDARISLVVFTGPANETIIEPLPGASVKPT